MFDEYAGIYDLDRIPRASIQVIACSPEEPERANLADNPHNGRVTQGHISEIRYKGYPSDCHSPSKQRDTALDPIAPESRPIVCESN